MCCKISNGRQANDITLGKSYNYLLALTKLERNQAGIKYTKWVVTLQAASQSKRVLILL